MSNIKQIVIVGESTSSASFLEQLAAGQCLCFLQEKNEEFRHPTNSYMFLKKGDEIIYIDKYAWDTWQIKISYLPASVFYFLYNLKDDKDAIPHIRAVVDILYDLSSDYYKPFHKNTKSKVIKSKKNAISLLDLDFTNF